MKPSIQLRLGQHLTMTPQLQQAIRLLQLSALELRAEVQQALESNPMLELTEEDEAEGLAESEWEGENGAADRTAGELEGEGAAEAGMGESGALGEAANDVQTRDSDVQLAEIPDELPVDSVWDDIYDTAVVPAGPAYSGDELRGVELHSRGSESLREHLSWQMRLTPFGETDLAIATVIIDSIDDDGYLTCSLEDVAQSLSGSEPVEVEEVEAVLHRIQRFDPVGVGSRDLRECLLVQLEQLDESTPWLVEAKELVRLHLNLLASRDFTQLMRRMKLSHPELVEVVKLIQSMNPRPGSSVTDTEPDYVIPDVIVRKNNGAWQVELNPEALPSVRINAQYARLIKRANNSSDNTFLKNNLQEARWFLKSLRSRNETLLKVATSIVKHQRAFLEHGEEAMKALVLHDVSEALGMHESTVSRVTTQKYLWTPRGIYELKYFFSSHVSTTSGGECSATAIRALIKKLVAAEEPSKPLSDSKIAETLAEQGINVARRTVAKYREAMMIPPSNERKRLA